MSHRDVARINMLLELLSDWADVHDFDSLVRTAGGRLRWVIASQLMTLAVRRGDGLSYWSMARDQDAFEPCEVEHLPTAHASLLCNVLAGQPPACGGPAISALCYPLESRGILIGALCISNASATYTYRDIRFLHHVALSLSGTIARLELSATIQRQRAEAEESQAAARAKDDFLAVLGHELRTPLAAMLIWARVLRSGTLSSTEVARAGDAMVRCAESQSRLIDDLLDLSRLAYGRLALSLSAVDVRSVAEEAVETVKPLALDKGITLSTSLEDVGVLRLDRTRVKQIFWNLLSNAVKFTPSGGSVKVIVKRSSVRLELEVVDTGEGIAPEFLPCLFQKFQQANMGDARCHMGLGIGLALAKQLAELHGGTIEAESKGLGGGSTFRVTLPCVEAKNLVRDVDGSRFVDEPSAPSLAGIRLLLVEDDANTRDAMHWTLERAGAFVIAVGGGREALAALDADAELQIIVSDLGLPAMTGYELLERVVERYRSRGVRVPMSCAVSAHVHDADRLRALNAGFDMYLAKPITPERLIEAVADLREVLAASGTGRPTNSD